MLRERRRQVDLGLLVLRSVVRHVAGVAELLERLPQAGDVAMAEDPPDPGDEAGLPSVALHELLGHEPDDRLADRQPNGAHGCLLSAGIAGEGLRRAALAAGVVASA